jgi:topoisomerase-4 subunit A
MQDVLKKIQDYALEEIMGDRFGKYAKEIIQDRAIPDVRDGLKPVQRRILYAMYKANNTHEKGYIKCAATVGDVLGKYHPHGDTSVYDAMVRMSQWWKQNHILIDIHGNNGSMDGDSAAAYRYTEARLSKISSELLKDLEKDTVAWAPNFDDRFLEPIVLPAKFPNLLVNGASGISAGYATNIPPHNLGEIIDATVKRIESPNSRLETILEIVKGPDFPTGGIVEGKDGIIEAFKTGRGRVIVRSKIEFKKTSGKEQIIITEIPFEVNKASLVNKIDGIRIDKKIDGISEVRDETDREGLRIAIDLKSGANKEVVLNYLLKNTELQISYNYNMVAIVNRRPMTLGILELLDAYIAHQKEVIIKRSEFDLAAYKKEHHIIEGLIKALSILDDVIKTIRRSKNKMDAEENLVKEYAFTIEQAKAIVILQLYKLTNTDVLELETKLEQLKQFIKALESILNDPEKLKDVMMYELKKIKKEYFLPRKTIIKDEITEIKLDTKDLIMKEKVVVVITNDGYLKKVSLKSFASNEEETALKAGDYVLDKYETTTLDNLVLFTSLGNYIYLPVHLIPEIKWKELGKHISNIVTLKDGEKIINSLLLKKELNNIIIFTKKGLVKKIDAKLIGETRSKKAMTLIKLKENDEVIDVRIEKKQTLIVSKNGYHLLFNSDLIPLTGLKSGGVKGINLKEDEAVSGLTIDENSEYLNIFTNNKTAKRIKVTDLEELTRAKKGTRLIKNVKAVNYTILKAILSNSKDIFGLKTDNEIIEIKNSEIPIMDLLSTGSIISKEDVLDVFKYPDIIKAEEAKIDALEEKSEAEAEVKEMTIDDFLGDFKL